MEHAVKRPWVEETPDGQIHIYLPQLLAALGIPPTAENLARAARITLETVDEVLPDVPAWVEE